MNGFECWDVYADDVDNWARTISVYLERRLAPISRSCEIGRGCVFPQVCCASAVPGNGSLAYAFCCSYTYIFCIILIKVTKSRNEFVKNTWKWLEKG
jgi:hypothetical protein